MNDGLNIIHKPYSTIFFNNSKSKLFVKLLSSLSDEGIVTYRKAIVIICGFAEFDVLFLKYAGLYL